MCIAAGTGASVQPPDEKLSPACFYFGEDQARYLLAARSEQVDGILRAAAEDGIPVRMLGRFGGRELQLASLGSVAVDTLRRRHAGWFPSYMNGNTGGTG